MISTDYKIEALDILLDKTCLSERFYPLTEYKDLLLTGLLRLGCRTKSDAELLSDEVLLGLGLDSVETVALFRRFLGLYDPKTQKFREIVKVTSDPEKQAAYTELYHLPGVKQTRASLYYRAGYKSIEAFSGTTVDEILEKTARVISENGLTCIVPLPKEVRTHIAVAKAFTLK